MEYVLISIIMLSLDSLYLSLIGQKLFNPMINIIQKEKMSINIHAAIITYIFLLIVLYKFIIQNNKSPNDAFLLGLCIYGVFEFTNLTIFKKYQLTPAIVDTLWGGILFYLTTYLTYKYINYKKNNNLF